MYHCITVSVYLCVYHVSLYIYLSSYVTLHISVNVSCIWVSMCLWIYISISMYHIIFVSNEFMYLFMYVQLYLYICLSMYLYIYIYVSLYLCIWAQSCVLGSCNLDLCSIVLAVPCDTTYHHLIIIFTVGHLLITNILSTLFYHYCFYGK